MKRDNLLFTVNAFRIINALKGQLQMHKTVFKRGIGDPVPQNA